MTDNSYDALARAATDAVSESLEKMTRVTTRLGRLTDFLKETADDIRLLQINNVETDPRARLNAKIDRYTVQVEELLQRQWEAFQTFNVVLFGRTGVGKSTLISAMTRSNGASVSQGESDWTTAVDPVDWHSCRLYDTPGINGWGRTVRREDLETRAREAVEVADLVIVCFDSQSQQASEFEKLAAWVQSYRKPVVAVLNCRNPRWRLPPRVPVGSARVQLSRAVREHAGNIRDELAKIGLTGVPVVALSLKRALFARAELPFEGPDGSSLEAQCRAFGTDMLGRWSGYSTFEGLLVRAVSDHAVPLRIGALNDQLRGVISELDRAIGNLQGETAETAETIENELVVPLLRLLGYPPQGDSELRKPLLDDENQDLLADLERNRGGAFEAPVTGEYREFVTQRLDAELGALRSRSLQNAEECVIQAFARKENLSAGEIRKTAFAEEETRAKAEAVLLEGAKFLERRAKLAIRDTHLDLKVLSSWTATSVEGKAGSGWRHSAWGFKGGGILSGAAAALGMLTLSNIWNPIGWVGAVPLGVMVIGSIASMLFGWLGGKARKEAERRRLTARRQALAKVRRNVHEVYDRFADEILEQAHSLARAPSRQILRPAVEQALVHRLVQSHCSSLRARFTELSGDRRTTVEPQFLLYKVATTIERNTYPERSDASVLHWLGEDWIDDPAGLKSARGSTDAGRTKAYDPTIFNRLLDGIRDIVDRIADDVMPGSGSTWLTTARERCTGDADADEALSELQAMAESGRPRIHLVGDYSAGKTSFIRRLLVDAGSPVPETLEVRADPTTDTPREYEWDGITLIDNPGFQSSDLAHDESALRALSDASAVLYLFQPNLIVGDDGYMTTVLRGSMERGMIPRQNQTFFVVNRSDELGVDPDDDPDAYRQLVQRKQTELSVALRSRNIHITSERVFCMASDPYGLVGNRADVDASAFDAYRDWDGFRQFTTNFRRVKTKLLRSGCDRSILGGGLSRLASLQANQRSIAAELAAKDSALGRLQVQIHDLIAEGQRLGDKRRADLDRLVSEHAAGLREDVLYEHDQERLKIQTERLTMWWNDPALHDNLERWARTTAYTLNSWQERSSEALVRRSKSMEFRAVLGDHHEDIADLSTKNMSTMRIAEVVREPARWLVYATRNNVYRIGKVLGFKFKPWGAVKLAGKLGRVGAVLPVVVVGLDIADLFLDERRHEKRERERQNIARFLRESVPRVVETIAFGEEDEPGILKKLEADIETLKDLAGDQSSKRENLAARIRESSTKLNIYDELMSDATKRLGNPWEVQ